jgi:hypothetical protein
MLQQVCEELHNFDFEKGRVNHSGTFTIAGGMIFLPFLLDGQRFLIVGSVLNDGMYTYHETGIKNDDDTKAAGLHDETWAGTICALAVPPTVIALSEDIKAWVDEYGEASKSPYSSEEVIGVYSYTKASSVGGSSSGGIKPITWQDMFANQLKRWRRVAFS